MSGRRRDRVTRGRIGYPRGNSGPIDAEARSARHTQRIANVVEARHSPCCGVPGYVEGRASFLQVGLEVAADSVDGSATQEDLDVL